MDTANILQFLQEGIDKGLTPSTIKVQIAALSVYLEKRLQEDPFIARFCKAISRRKPVRVNIAPSWDLSVVLKAFLGSPFEPISEASLRLVTFKTVLLVAITSARRVSEIQALSVREPFLQILEDRVILKTDPGFLPKVASNFHRSQDIVLPSFCQKASNEKEKRFHLLDVRRCILEYLRVTNPFRISDSLFVLFSGQRKGQKASKVTIARWIRLAIAEGYKTVNKDPPGGIKAHSTRALSASWAERAGATPEQICKAATWSSFSTFTRHYRLDLMSSQDQAFGRKVLQAVVPP